MRLPRSNRKTWALAGVLVVIAAAVAAYAIHELGKPGNTVQPERRVQRPTTPTTTTPTKQPVNNFTVPFYGNGPTRTRDFVGDADLNKPSALKLAWKFGGNALLEFPATIWGNNLYLLDDGATVKRVKISNGKQIWEKHLGKLSASSPSLDVAHKELFVSILSLHGSTIGSVNGELAALSMKSGKTLWTFPVSSGTESSPMVVGNSVYFGDQGGTEHSLNVKTGKQNWAFPTGGSIKAGADYYDGNLYFGNYGGSFYAVNAKTGKKVWAASPGGEFYSTPAAAYGRIYVGNNNGDAYSFEAGSGAVAWSRSLGSYVYSGPAVATFPASARRSSSAPTTATSTPSTPGPVPPTGPRTCPRRSGPGSPDPRRSWAASSTPRRSTRRAASASTYAPASGSGTMPTARTRPSSPTSTICS